jgi:hypothetical protein
VPFANIWLSWENYKKEELFRLAVISNQGTVVLLGDILRMGHVKQNLNVRNKESLDESL